MAIVRANRQRGYTLIDNQAIGNGALTWAAEGLLHYLLSKPDGWSVNPSHLWQEKKGIRGCGRDAVYKLLNELIDVGFVLRIQLRDERGVTDGYDYYVYDVPRQAVPEFHEGIDESAGPYPEFQETEPAQTGQGMEPHPENQETAEMGANPHPENPYPENPYPEFQDISNYGSTVNTDLSLSDAGQNSGDSVEPENPHHNALLDGRVPHKAPTPQAGMFPMTLEWEPGNDFARIAALTGLADAGYTPELLNEFRFYWQPTGRVYYHSQWQQKFIQSLKQQYAKGARYVKPTSAGNGGSNAADRFQQGLAAIQAVQDKYGYGSSGTEGNCFEGDYSAVPDPLADVVGQDEYAATGGDVWGGTGKSAGRGGNQT
ncbi:Primosomal protein 1 [Paramixta manurensis]|uniref:Primosomal protein 1 n=1 Tax=Paramixta manurensis TaxID=2740817 RepID=A0A6M8UQJ4_9GAMM|nr:Primosomal protein 1 [Erwiniaceae bacterium PD-1]